jgi:hypothetical protein
MLVMIHPHVSAVYESKRGSSAAFQDQGPPIEGEVRWMVYIFNSKTASDDICAAV